MQQVLEGISSLREIIRDEGYERVLVVAGRSFSGLQLKEDVLRISGQLFFFSDFVPNPTFENVNKGVKSFKENHCDSILAIGGGSAIDVAKCIKLACITESGVKSLIPPLAGERLETKGKLPLIAIPTTAGSGSESTHNAVIYYKGAKQTVVNDAILPDYAILEPSSLMSLPLYQRKCTMLDALCQAIESWWSVKSTDESKSYSRKAVRLIMDNWRGYICNINIDVAGKMMLAANYAGKAINIAETTAAHAMSYKLSSMYNLPHGHAVAICLPEVWQYILENKSECSDVRGESYMMETMSDIAREMGCQIPDDSILNFKAMLKHLDILRPQSGNRNSDVGILAASVNPIRLKNTPTMIRTIDFDTLYTDILS